MQGNNDFIVRFCIIMVLMWFRSYCSVNFAICIWSCIYTVACLLLNKSLEIIGSTNSRLKTKSSDKYLDDDYNEVCVYVPVGMLLSIVLSHNAW